MTRLASSLAQRTRRAPLLVSALALCCAASCSDDTREVSPAEGAETVGAGEDATSIDGDVESTSVPLEVDSGQLPDGGDGPALRCSPGPGSTGSPKTMVEVVELINSLPMPVTIPCLLQSLDRPLRVMATASVISAQPANGQDNPRLFLIGDGISLSVVPTGDSAHLLEVGELTSNTRSIKGEIGFPVTEPLALDAPFKRIARDVGGTICYVCHHPETAAEDYPIAGAFESTAYRPVPGLEINFDYVEYQYTTCDYETEPDRCAFFAALFDQGQVSRGEFPQEMAVFE